MKAYNQSITLTWGMHTTVTIEAIERQLSEIISNDQSLIQWVITDKQGETLLLDLMLTTA